MSIYSFLQMFGLLACLVSTFFSIQLYSSFAQTGLDKLVYTACGITLQGMQTISYVCAWLFLWNGKKRNASIGFACFGVLMVLSIVASIGFFSVVNKKSSTSALHNSDVYVGMKQKLASIDSEITSLQKQIAGFAAKGYITKGVKPAQERLDILRNERQQTLEAIQNYTLTPDVDALYAYLAEFTIGENYTRQDVQRIKLWIYLLSAIALDLVSAVLLGFSMELKGADNLPLPRSNPDSPGDNSGNPPNGRKPRRRDEDDEYILRPGYSMGPSTVPGTTHAELVIYNQELEERLKRLEQGSNSVRTSVPYREANQGTNGLEPGANPSVRYKGANQGTNGGYNGLELEANPSVPYNGTKPSANHPVQYHDDFIDPESIPEVIRGCLPAYVDNLFPVKPRIDQSLCGRRSIADAIGISQKTADKAHNWLKSVDLIYVKGTKTHSDYTKPEMLRILGMAEPYEPYTYQDTGKKVINFDKREV